ncbi:ankyrin [Stipitochalara longipes BDJ]|nr:ankyrin [Stipitochalara longipes BDJ]
MDIVSSASAVVGLVFNFATAAKTCKAVRGRYKDASLTIDSIKQELETLQAALQQLANLMMHDASALTSQWDTDQSLSGTFARSVKGFERTIRGLQIELDRLKLERQELGRLDKAKVVWNEDGMREHLARLRSQAGALQLLLHVIQVGAVSEVKQHVKNLESALLQASVTSNGDEPDRSEKRQSKEHTIQQDQGDLLDLTWSEKNSEVGTTKELLRSSYPGLIPTASDADYHTSETDSTSSNDSSPENDTVDISEDIRYIRTKRSYQEPDDRTNISTKFMPDQHESNMNSSKEPASLINVVIRGDIIAVTALLNSGYDIEAVENENERTSLMFAALLNQSEVLRVLLDKGANAAAKDKDGRTALHFAAAEGSYRCVELLLSYSAPVDMYDDLKEVPLHRAIRYDKPKIVKLLLPYYSDPMSFRDGQMRNIIHLAVEYCTIDMVEIICSHIRVIEHYKDCPIKDEEKAASDQRCPCPATYPHFDDVDILGDTAFHVGLILGHKRIVALLLQYQESVVEVPLRRTTYGNTPEILLKGRPLRWYRPLHYAIRFEWKRGDMYKVLVNGGANVNSKDSEGRTPLMLAKRYKNAEATAFLLARGAIDSNSKQERRPHLRKTTRGK